MTVRRMFLVHSLERVFHAWDTHRTIQFIVSSVLVERVSSPRSAITCAIYAAAKMVLSPRALRRHSWRSVSTLLFYHGIWCIVNP